MKWEPGMANCAFYMTSTMYYKAKGKKWRKKREKRKGQFSSALRDN